MFKLQMILICILLQICFCATQLGPDPWDDGTENKRIFDEDDLPPDLRSPKPKEKRVATSSQGMSDWFFKRLLAMILKGSERKVNEDNTVDISVQMKYTQEQLDVLNEYITSNNALSEEMLRRTLGYIEESIYKPSITEKIAMAWSEHVYSLLVEYKDYITWSLCIAVATTTTFWLWRHISHKHIIILIVIGLYLYEAFVSYKEAEKEEVSRFLSAINACKWYFWTSECEVSPPDPLIMLKHMNPLKIGVRMFTTIISEPMITISSTVNTMLHGITGDLIYPLNIITQGILVVLFNGLLIVLLVGILFNYLLNIPFQLNLFFNIFSLGLLQRDRNITRNHPVHEPSIQGDRITGETFNKVLDLFSTVLTVNQSTNNNRQQFAITNSSQGQSMKRSASTGRLPHIKCSEFETKEVSVIKRRHGGSGDAN